MIHQVQKSRRHHAKRAATGVLALGLCCVVSASVAAEFYAPMSSDDVRTRVLQWIAGQGEINPPLKEQVAQMWGSEADALPPANLFARAIATFAIVEPATNQFITACTLVDAPLIPPTLIEPLPGSSDEFHAANLRLFYARYLVRRQMYDEALEVFESIDPGTVINPATCLYFKSVCEHQLLMKDEGLKTIKTLLENTEGVPVRFSSVATLMQYELESLGEESLDGISHKMKDSKRRLELARGGRRVQKVQEEIIVSLDEIIKKIEQQQGGGGGGGGGSSRSKSNTPGSPANDSVIKGSTAPGEVDEKTFKNKGGWGNLDDKQENRAKNLINRNYPAHFRKQVEEYFKKLAKRRASSEK